jgi:Protein of unknown function (DUF2493).
MKVIIAGGRDYVFTERDAEDLDRLHALIGITEVVEGEAPGADLAGKAWALERGLPVKPFPADWEKYKQPGRKNPAGAIRNEQMAQYVGMFGAAVLFPGGPGTENMYKAAKRHGLQIFDWRTEPRRFP